MTAAEIIRAALREAKEAADVAAVAAAAAQSEYDNAVAASAAAREAERNAWRKRGNAVELAATAAAQLRAAARAASDPRPLVIARSHDPRLGEVTRVLAIQSLAGGKLRTKWAGSDPEENAVGTWKKVDGRWSYTDRGWNGATWTLDPIDEAALKNIKVTS